MEPARLDRLVRQGLARIRAEQSADGSFANFSAPDPGCLAEGARYATTFIPSLILGGLNRLPASPDLEAVRKPLAAFLVAERGEAWSYNYWTASSPERASMAYPDDLDDTFTALAGLYGYDPSLVGGGGTARSLRLLTACEVRPGGPYRTWLVAPDAKAVWRDVDLAVNSNVAYFLSLHGASVPGITGLQERAIAEGAFDSPYYHGWQPVAYFVARSYAGVRREELASLIASRPADGNLAQEALSLSALALLGTDPASLDGRFDAFVRRLEREGWPAAAVIRDPYVEGRLHFAGCPALTAALCLEAVALCRRKAASVTRLGGTGRAALAALRDERLAPGLTAGRRRLLGRILGGEAGARLLNLPAFLASCLKRRTVSESFVTDLALVTAHGWMAYTVYDDFLDGEGVPADLPLANVSLRALAALLADMAPGTGFPAAARDRLDRMEAANAWEAGYCRMPPPGARVPLRPGLPSYGPDLAPLAERSIGHALAPLAMLAAEGYGPASPEWRSMEAFFFHYLIARQLNDDAHDWQDDLRRGHLTYAVCRLLEDAAAASGTKAASWKRLERRYWHVTVAGLCQRILAETEAARAVLGELSGIMRTDRLATLLEPYEAAARAALATHRDTEEFLAAYSDL